jgi:hypothetical protein
MNLKAADDEREKTEAYICQDTKPKPIRETPRNRTAAVHGLRMQASLRTSLDADQSTELEI